MFEELIAAAKERGTEIMELEFIEGNERAKRLYEKFGFRVVSEKPNAFKLKDGTYQKEFCMQKYLYDVVSSRYERASFTEEKIKTLLDMGVISGGVKLENGELIVAPLEKSKTEQKAEIAS